jgi:hypothetical protein
MGNQVVSENPYTAFAEEAYVPQQVVREERSSKPIPIGMEAHPEDQLILACARVAVGSEKSEEIKSLIGQHINWSYTIRKASRNGVMPLLCLNLIRICPDLMPEAVLAECNKYWRDQAQNNLFQTAELLKLLRLLDSHKILALPFKGPTLAAYAYRNLSLRQFCDLDILVRKRDIKKIVKLLTRTGFKLTSSPTWLQRLPTPASRKKDFGLISDDGQVRVELHWRFSGTHFDLPVNLKYLWGRLETITLAGCSVRSLPLNDLLLYLTMHGSRHGWERLIWVCDIAELVGVYNKDIDWSQLLAQASALGSKRNLLVGLHLASVLLNAKLTEEVSQAIETDPVVKQASEQARGFLFRDDDTSPSLSYWQSYHLGMKERLRERLRLRFHYWFRYLHIAFTPNAKDHAIVALPRFLFFAYYLVRAIRLVKSYGLSYWNGIVKTLTRP